MPTVSGFTVVLADRVRETTQTTGTGTYSLDGAPTGKRTFAAGIGSGNRTLYTAELGADWEVALGTVTSGAPATVSRDVILASSNGGAAVSWPPGIKDIFCDVAAALANQTFPQTLAFGGLKVTTFTTSGTWTRDAKCIAGRIRMVGGGGSGGGAGSTGASEGSDAGGGGAGEYAEGWFTAAQLGSSQTVTRGAGGTGVGGDNPGGSGGTTSFGSLLTAAGGSGGTGGAATVGGTNSAGGTGGTGGTGTGLRMPGSDGGRGRVTDGFPHYTGFGGASVLSGSRQSNAAGSGLSGKNYGGGGSGASNTPNSGGQTGGGGANGVVIVEEFLSP